MKKWQRERLAESATATNRTQTELSILRKDGVMCLHNQVDGIIVVHELSFNMYTCDFDDVEYNQTQPVMRLPDSILCNQYLHYFNEVIEQQKRVVNSAY